MKIQVTEEHIEAGVREDCYLCPIALAIKEQVEIKSVSVASVANINYMSGTRKVYKLSRAAINFIERFDGGKKVKPFNFVMTHYDPWA